MQVDGFLGNRTIVLGLNVRRKILAAGERAIGDDDDQRTGGSCAKQPARERRTAAASIRIFTAPSCHMEKSANAILDSPCIEQRAHDIANSFA